MGEAKKRKKDCERAYEILSSLSIDPINLWRAKKGIHKSIPRLSKKEVEYVI